MKCIRFTHYWVSGFGWEITIFQTEDFATVEQLGFNDVDGYVFLGIDHKDCKHILKGGYIN